MVLDADSCSNSLLLTQMNGLHSKTDNVEQHFNDSLAIIEQRLLDS